MRLNDKEVNFHKYCQKCKDKDLKEWKSPCNECLDTPIQRGTHKPINFRDSDK